MSTKQQEAIEFQERALFHGVWRSCLNCDHWNPNVEAKKGVDVKAEEKCKKFNVLPPLKVIVVSCPEWLPYVPF